MAPILPLGPVGVENNHSLSRLQGEKSSRNNSGLCTVSDLQLKKNNSYYKHIYFKSYDFM